MTTGQQVKHGMPYVKRLPLRLSRAEILRDIAKDRHGYPSLRAPRNPRYPKWKVSRTRTAASQDSTGSWRRLFPHGGGAKIEEDGLVVSMPMRGRGEVESGDEESWVSATTMSARVSFRPLLQAVGDDPISRGDICRLPPIPRNMTLPGASTGSQIARGIEPNTPSIISLLSGYCLNHHSVFMVRAPLQSWNTTMACARKG